MQGDVKQSVHLDFVHINTPENNPKEYGKGEALKNDK